MKNLKINTKIKNYQKNGYIFQTRVVKAKNFCYN